MKLRALKENIAPMTKEQYEARVTYAKKEAQNLINQVTCFRKTLHINGETYSWNGCTQKVLVQEQSWQNEIPKEVAKLSFECYLYAGLEYTLI